MKSPFNIPTPEMISMPPDGTPEWHEIRRVSGVTASECPAVMGLSKWATALDIYLLKTGLVAPAESNSIMEWGTAVEPLIRAKFEKEYGISGHKPDYMFRSTKYPWMCANLDWVATMRVDNADIGAEFKYSDSTRGWGESHSQDVPEAYYIQVQHQLLVTGLDVIYLYVKLPFGEFRTYPITPAKDIQAKIAEVTCEFWENNVKAGVAPDATDPDSVKKLFSNVKDSEVELPEDARDWVADHIEYKAQIEQLEAKKKECEARLLQLMGENRRASIPGWSGSITRSQSPDKQVPEEVVPAHVKPGRFTFRINHPRS